MDEAIRLQRYLSQCGVAARRKAEELITSGVVSVNGQRVTELGTKVVPGRDRVSVRGEAVYPEEPFYVLLNKPKGCLTAVTDPENRPTVMEYLHGLPARVVPVGRLDFYSEGVLLLTNDGDLSARLQSPRHHVEKTYHVKVRDQVTERHLEVLRQGVRLEDGTVTRPAQIDMLGGTKSRHDWLVITLTEGKSRQIHRMLGVLGYTVMKLQRVAFGGLTFHGLRVGDARELTQAEVNDLRELVGLPKDTVARGKWTSRREETERARRSRARARVGMSGGRDGGRDFRTGGRGRDGGYGGRDGGRDRGYGGRDGGRDRGFGGRDGDYGGRDGGRDGGYGGRDGGRERGFGGRDGGRDRGHGGRDGGRDGGYGGRGRDGASGGPRGPGGGRGDGPRGRSGGPGGGRGDGPRGRSGGPGGGGPGGKRGGPSRGGPRPSARPKKGGGPSRGGSSR